LETKSVKETDMPKKRKQIETKTSTKDMDSLRKDHAERTNQQDVYKQAEKILDKSPELKRMRSIKDGLKPSSGIQVGGGDPKYAEGWDRIFGKKDEEK